MLTRADLEQENHSFVEHVGPQLEFLESLRPKVLTVCDFSLSPFILSAELALLAKLGKELAQDGELRQVNQAILAQ